MIWTPRQRAGIAVLTGLILALLGWRLWRWPAHVPAELPAEGPEAHRVAGRIDPNVASEAELAALPGIGPALAARIVEARALLRAADPSRPAFAEAQDLTKVRGIGPAVMSKVEPYLVFPAQAPASRPGDAP